MISGAYRSSPAEPDLPQPASSSLLPVYVLVAFAALATFVRATSNGFLDWDDVLYVVENDHIRSIDLGLFAWAFSSLHGALWIPLTWISFALDRAVWGPGPFGFHLTNVLLHAACAALVAGLAARLYLRHELPVRGERDAPESASLLVCAAAAGLFWGLHPLRVESVAWISERKDVLAACLCLLSLLAWERYTRGRRGFSGTGAALGSWPYRLSLLLFVAAMLSKPMASVLPALLIVMDSVPFGRVLRARDLVAATREKIPFLALGAADLVVTVIAQRPALVDLVNAPLSSRIVGALGAISKYAAWTVWPVGLSPFHLHPGPLDPAHLLDRLGPAAIGVLLLAVAAFAARTWPAVGAAALWFVVALAPVSGLVQAGGQELADRFTYVPSIGPTILAAGALVGVVERFRGKGARRAAQIAVLLFVAGISVALAFGTNRQIRHWRNPETFWSRVIELSSSPSGMAYCHRGEYRLAVSRTAEALDDFSRSLEIAKRKNVRGGLARSLEGRAGALERLGRIDEAAADRALLSALVSKGPLAASAR